MNTDKGHLSLTVVLVQDEKTKGFTSYFAEIPNIISEGENEEEATNNLIRTAKVVFEHQKNIELSSIHAANIKTRSFELLGS